MELLQKLPCELQRIVVSYSQPKYPYLLELRKQTFIDQFNIYIDCICPFCDLFSLRDDVINVNRMFYKLYKYNDIYPWNNRIILEQYQDRPYIIAEYMYCAIIERIQDIVNDLQLGRYTENRMGIVPTDYFWKERGYTLFPSCVITNRHSAYRQLFEIDSGVFRNYDEEDSDSDSDSYSDSYSEEEDNDTDSD